MKSSLKNMILVLFVISLVCSAAVAYVSQITKEPIEKAKQQKAMEALRKVLPEFDVIADTLEIDGCSLYPVLKSGEPVGYAVSTLSPNGFNGNVKLMVGFLEDGTIYDVAVLEQGETPGLGAKMSEENNPLRGSFKGKNAAQMDMRVRKDGGEVDAITAATISSRAYSEAVQFAYEAFKKRNDVAEECADNEAAEGLIVVEGSAKGYNRSVPVVLKVSFDEDSTIVDVEVVEQKETPNLGGVMTQEDNVLLQSVKGKKASELNLSIRTAGGDVDVISGATISSRAYANALKAAYEEYKTLIAK